jgi:multidrug resistance efflux pump
MTFHRPSNRPPLASARLVRTGLALVLLLLLAPALAACNAGDNGGEAANRDGETVADDAGTSARGEGAEGAEDTPGPTPTLDRNVERVVTADGALELPLPPQALTFRTAGEVREVTVTVGDPVEVGDLLVVVDPETLERTILDAQTSVTTAREGLASAQLALARSERGTELETARLEVERSKNSLWSQQVQRDSICGRSGTAFVPQSDCDAAQASVQASEQGVAIAEESYAAAQASREGELAAARARVSSARANLAQADRAVKRAEQDRANATIVAPFAGVVQTVHIAPGVEAAPGAPAVTLAKTKPLDFVTSNLGERYVGDVTEGAPVEITLTAWPDQPLLGHVRRIAASGQADAGGAIVYRVWMAVDETQLPLRAGMTGRVEIGVGAE